MKAGKSLRTFVAEDGRCVTLRTIRWEDLEDCLEMINALVTEKANIDRDTAVSRQEEADWLGRALSSMEKGERIHVVAEVGGKMVGNSEVSRRLGGYDKHVGVIGIAIRNGYRDVGIGTEMMKVLIEQGKVMELRVLALSAFANNTRAIRVYEKVGFIQTGKIPKNFFKDGKYIDKILMTKVLE
jgi:putative acetyltransferase